MSSTNGQRNLNTWIYGSFNILATLTNICFTHTKRSRAPTSVLSLPTCGTWKIWMNDWPLRLRFSVTWAWSTPTPLPKIASLLTTTDASWKEMTCSMPSSYSEIPRSSGKTDAWNHTSLASSSSCLVLIYILTALFLLLLVAILFSILLLHLGDLWFMTSFSARYYR